MPYRQPARTAKGRDVLLDRSIDLDSRLRTVLAQCDGKRDEAQIEARFGAIVDVRQAIDTLLGMALIELPVATAPYQPSAAETAPLLSAVPDLAQAAVTGAGAAMIETAVVTASGNASSDPFAEWFPSSMRQPRERAA